MWRVLAAVWAVASVGTVVWFIRLGRLRVKYAVPTMGLGVLVGLLAAWPRMAWSLADRLGVGSPMGLIALLVLAYASGMSLVAVRELSRLEARTRSLAEAVALLDARTHDTQQQQPAVRVVKPGDGPSD